jgi:hypothetical protein
MVMGAKWRIFEPIQIARCCACPASGQSAALESRAMNFRRFIDALIHDDDIRISNSRNSTLRQLLRRNGEHRPSPAGIIFPREERWIATSAVP